MNKVQDAPINGEPVDAVTKKMAPVWARWCVNVAQNCQQFFTWLNQDVSTTGTPTFTSVTIGGVVFSSGTGAPSASLPKGSYYSRTDGSSPTTRLYVATDSVGGWTSITTAT